MPWACRSRSSQTRRGSPAPRPAIRPCRPSPGRSRLTATSIARSSPSRSEPRRSGEAAVNELAHSLFAMGHPWWELVLRGTAVYVAVRVLVRMVGKRTVGQFTPFDLVLVVVLGESVEHSLVGEDHSLVGGLVLAATLLTLNWAVGFITARWPAFDRLVEG